MQKVYEFLNVCGHILSCHRRRRHQARVRPFGTIDIFEDKLYIQTGKSKDVSKQIQSNPNVEICGFQRRKVASPFRQAGPR
jgi:uncharacterized pyridoxamine 5'-phosphate oxidase family protein